MNLHQKNKNTPDQEAKALLARIRSSLMGALLVASIIVLLKHYGFLDRLKTITLSSIISVAPADHNNNRKEDEEEPFLFIIKQSAYETYFNQCSPLDRGILSEMLSFFDTEGNRPKVLAIDLDLSPNHEPGKCIDKNNDGKLSPSDNNNKDTKLLCRLESIAKNGTELVLVVPEPVLTKKAREAKLSWMKRLLSSSKHVHFGISTLLNHDGVVLKYIKAPSTFAHAIMRSVKNIENKNNDNKEVTSMEVMRQPYDGGNLNPALEKSLSLLINRKWRNGLNEYDFFKDQHIKILNPDYIKLPDKHIIELKETEKKDTDTEKFHESFANLGSLKIKDKIVILGGDYGTTDYSITPHGKYTGVMLHYAAYYSIINREKKVINWVEFVLDIIVGFFLSLYLHWILKINFLIKHIILRMIPVVSVIAVIMLLGFFSLLLFQKSDIWINPAPLFVGILIEVLVKFIVDGKEKTDNKIEVPGCFFDKLKDYIIEKRTKSAKLVNKYFGKFYHKIIEIIAKGIEIKNRISEKFRYFISGIIPDSFKEFFRQWDIYNCSNIGVRIFLYVGLPILAIICLCKQ